MVCGGNNILTCGSETTVGNILQLAKGISGRLLLYEHVTTRLWVCFSGKTWQSVRLGSHQFRYCDKKHGVYHPFSMRPPVGACSAPEIELGSALWSLQSVSRCSFQS